MLLGVKGVGRSRGGVWSEGLVRPFENRRQIAAYAGLAPSVNKEGWQCTLGANPTFLKTKGLIIPVLPELRAIIDVTPTGHLTLLVTKTGKSYSASDFSDQFRKWCDDVGLPPECSFHGLRKAALTRLANRRLYRRTRSPPSAATRRSRKSSATPRAADQVRLARAAMERTARAEVPEDGANDGRPGNLLRARRL